MLVGYVENAEYPAKWLENLIENGAIDHGIVYRDTAGKPSDIRDITPGEVRILDRFHAFAGIGLWALALRQAGWPEHVPVWTGSCPCQPFSQANPQRRGTADKRHLWPEWRRLIRECRPAIIFGEQVASKDGRAWFHDVRADLVGMGYAVGAADLASAGAGAPHIRQRTYFVGVQICRLGDTDRQRCEEFGVHLCQREPRPTVPETTGTSPYGRAPTTGYWAEADWLYTVAGCFRPAEPGTFPLAARHSAQMEQLRAYGNGLVVPVAQAFIECVMDELGIKAQ